LDRGFFSGRPKMSEEGGIEELPGLRPRRRSSSATRAVSRSFAAASSSFCRWSSPISARRSSREADPNPDDMTMDPAAPTPYLSHRQTAKPIMTY
jgi:hypothetical protein